MKYLILVCYIILFTWLGEELGDGITQIAFLGGIVKAIGASKDARKLQAKADGLNPVRPEYEIPQEVQDYMTNAMNMAQGDMAGYGRQMNRASGNTANTMGQARNFADSGTSLLQSLSMADASQRRQTGDIDAQNLQFRQGNMNNLQGALLNVAGYQDQKFDFNENQPYIQAEMDKRAFEQAAFEQKRASRDAIASTIDGAINTGMAVMGAPMGSGGGSLFGKIFGGGGSAATAATTGASSGFRANMQNFKPSKF